MHNYIELATRTVSDQFHGKDIAKFEEATFAGETVNNLFTEVIAVSNAVDVLKKFLYYGKLVEDLPTAPFELDLQAVDPDILHAVLGVISESGELLQALGNNDKLNMVEEGGDFLWYLALLFKKLETTFPKVMAKNIAKLEARYPTDKFSQQDAVNRDLEKETTALRES